MPALFTISLYSRYRFFPLLHVEIELLHLIICFKKNFTCSYFHHLICESFTVRLTMLSNLLLRVLIAHTISLIDSFMLLVLSFIFVSTLLIGCFSVTSFLLKLHRVRYCLRLNLFHHANRALCCCAHLQF